MRITLIDGKNAVTEGCVRVQASVLPYVTDIFVIFREVEWEVLEFIIPGGKNKWILLNESRQYFIGFLVMHKTEITHVNVVKDVRREGIKMRTRF